MKLLLRLALAAVALLALGGAAVVVFAGKAARVAIERGGTYALGVPTTLDEARLGLFSGRFGLHGLAVANPEGFQGEHFLQMSSGELEVSLGSLRSNRVEAPALVLDGVELTLERRDGRTNYGTILDHLEDLQKDDGGDRKEKKDRGEQREEGGEQEGGGEDEEQEFVIHEVVLRNVVAHLDLLPAGGELTRRDIRIPEIRLENVGNDADSISGLVAQLVTAVLAAVVEVGGEVLPDEVLKELKAGLAHLELKGFEYSEDTLATLDAVAESLGMERGELLDQAAKTLGDLLKR